jgi:isopenicillin N synthase-like dioxygenase
VIQSLFAPFLTSLPSPAITILNQDSVGGLEVLNANAHWIPAPPIEGTFVVNIGDFFMRLSNNRFLSTVHRVTNSTGRERYSVPFFWTMNMSSSIGVS